MILHQYEDTPPCPGMNCGCTDGKSHSKECIAEHTAACAGGAFMKWQPMSAAPKNEVIDAWCPEVGRIPDVWWDEIDEGWSFPAYELTHWVPHLPPPPSPNQ